MTDLLERAIERVRRLPEGVQDELAGVLLQLANLDDGIIELTAEEEASFDESLAQAERGEFASDVEMEAIRAKYAR